MADIKEQFGDFRENTPKYIQWLLLAVAFLIVIILLTLLLTKKHTDTKPISKVIEPATLVTSPTQVEFEDAKVGESAYKMLEVSVDMPVIVDNIALSQSGFSVSSTCLEDEIESCAIKITYKPTKEQNKAQTKLTITWHQDGQEDTMQTTDVLVTYNAIKEEPKEETPKEEEDIKEIKEEPEPVREIREIAVPNPIKREPVVEPEPVIVPEPVVEPEPITTPGLPPKQCSEFAIPGYDASGRQIGWIKPERGANYFYPLSDKNCSNATGKYDMSTGIITSLRDGTRIGTDSDHIGYRNVREKNLKIPELSAPNLSLRTSHAENGVYSENGGAKWSKNDKKDKFDHSETDEAKEKFMGSGRGESITSSKPYDRTFILRQFKPIPATIVSEVRADPSVYGCTKKGGVTCDENKNYSVPVRATVDRNVYSDDGRTIILPTGTLLMGYLDGDLPGPYQAFGRMNIRWYQFIRPDGIEFNFGDNQDPYSGDAQGRMGVPGHGSTDYVEQMVMPILTALVPAAVNMIAPITDKVINQIDLDNNTIVQSGTIRSSEMAKQDIINTWNKITQKLLVDAIDNTVPPFSIAAGTRINVFSPVDLIVSCEGSGATGKCALITAEYKQRRSWNELKGKVTSTANDSSWQGQIRSFNLNPYCKADKNNKITLDTSSNWQESGYDYRTVLAYCESQNYQAINNVKNTAYKNNLKKQEDANQKKYGFSQEWTNDGLQTNFDDDELEQKYNEEVLGLKYDDEGNMINPFAKPASVVANQDILTCEGGGTPDMNGCCPGETFTTDDNGNNCCLDSASGECYEPLTVE